MMARAVLGIVPLLLITAASCREEASPADVPLSAEELRQFDSPLFYAAWNEPGSWPQFCHDPLHTGRSDVDLETAEMEPAWRFEPTARAWAYEPGFSVWSSPVVGTIKGRTLVFAGCQDRNVYAVDALTGAKVWEFSPGAPVFASPALAMVDGRPIVVVGSTNRSIYGLDAATGKQIWQRETAAWSFTAARSVMSSPAVIGSDDGVPLVVIGVWNSDRSASNNVQAGECLAIRADNGNVQWRRRLAGVPVNSPAVARLQGKDTVFVACHDGTVHALGLADGAPVWESVLNDESRSSPCLGLVNGSPCVFVGSRLNSVFGLNARTGVRRWRVDTGYWVDSTPAWYATGAAASGGGTVVAGSYDRSVYAWNSDSANLRWQAPTGNYAYSSPAVARIGQKPVVLAISWDEHVYMFDGTTGVELWRTGSGPLIWSHAYMGDSLWASPVVALAGDRPLVLYPAFDGVLYAFRPIQRNPATQTATRSE
jgi:eukaryotic-like serine/threonine-protein kinase